MVSVNMYGKQNRIQLEMGDKVSGLMWIHVLTESNKVQFTSCRFDWRDWSIERHNLGVSTSLVVVGCGVFSLNDETDAAVIEQFLEDCKNGG